METRFDGHSRRGTAEFPVGWASYLFISRSSNFVTSYHKHRDRGAHAMLLNRETCITYSYTPFERFDLDPDGRGRLARARLMYLHDVIARHAPITVYRTSVHYNIIRGAAASDDRGGSPWILLCTRYTLTRDDYCPRVR